MNPSHDVVVPIFTDGPLYRVPKLAIESDLWTSKRCTFAFVGVVGYWIDEEWVLKECPLNLLTLRGNHGGRAAAKLICHDLSQRKVLVILLSNINVTLQMGAQRTTHRATAR